MSHFLLTHKMTHGQPCPLGYPATHFKAVISRGAVVCPYHGQVGLTSTCIHAGRNAPKRRLPNLRFGALRPAETSDFRFQMTTLKFQMYILNLKCII
jgi:hypothetical protein